MASEWIKLEMTTPDKPEVVQIAAALRCDQDLIVGKLVRVWVWADQNSIAGDSVPVTEVFLDRLAGRKGLAAAMRSVGWLEGKDGALVFPGFDRHNGRTAKARASARLKKAAQREEPAPASGPAVIVSAGKVPVPFEPAAAESTPAAARQVYPAALAESPEFARVWESEWLPYLIDRKHGQMPAIMTLEKQLGTCLRLGAAKAVAALKSAMEKGWAAPDENARPVAGDGGAAGSAALAAYYDEPEGWRAWWRAKYPPEEFPNAIRLDEGTWEEITIDYKKQIWAGLQKKHRRSA